MGVHNADASGVIDPLKLNVQNKIFKVNSFLAAPKGIMISPMEMTEEEGFQYLENKS